MSDKGEAIAELDGLSTEELRERAFARARERRDLHFFWSLFRRLPHADSVSPDGSLGIESGIEEAIGLWREFTGHGYGEEEPLVRAAFIEYLIERHS